MGRTFFLKSGKIKKITKEEEKLRNNKKAENRGSAEEFHACHTFTSFERKPAFPVTSQGQRQKFADCREGEKRGRKLGTIFKIFMLLQTETVHKNTGEKVSESCGQFLNLFY